MHNANIIEFLRNIKDAAMIKVTTVRTPGYSVVVAENIFHIMDINEMIDKSTYPKVSDVAIDVNNCIITIGDLSSPECQIVDDKLALPGKTLEFFKYTKIGNLTDDLANNVILSTHNMVSKFKLHTEFMDALKYNDCKLADGVTFDQCIEKIQEVYTNYQPQGIEGWYLYFNRMILDGEFDSIVVDE